MIRCIFVDEFEFWTREPCKIVSPETREISLLFLHFYIPLYLFFLFFSLSLLSLLHNDFERVENWFASGWRYPFIYRTLKLHFPSSNLFALNLNSRSFKLLCHLCYSRIYNARNIKHFVFFLFSSSFFFPRLLSVIDWNEKKIPGAVSVLLTINRVIIHK